MSFWSDDHRKVGPSFESGGGDFEPIPANTGVIAAIKNAEWSEYKGDRHISIRWDVVSPEQYKGRVVFQKVRVLDDDPAKADRAKSMLAAIDKNAGGALLKLDSEPTDYDLASALTGKMMALKLQVWELEIDGQQRSGNWVSAVSPSQGAAKQEPAQAASFDDVPF